MFEFTESLSPLEGLGLLIAGAICVVGMSMALPMSELMALFIIIVGLPVVFLLGCWEIAVGFSVVTAWAIGELVEYQRARTTSPVITLPGEG